MLLLLAAAHETQLIATLLPATMPSAEAAIPLVNPQLRQQQVLTLLFLNAVGLQRTWDLRSYTGAALALATGRSRAYGYRHTERVLRTLVATDGDRRLTAAVARWTSSLWQVDRTAATAPFYLDGHKKPVYSDHTLPRGLVGRRGAILGCRHLTFLHDQLGHPLLALTERGDTHLTRSIPAVLERFEGATGTQLRQLVIDREGMAAAFLQACTVAGRTVTTILRANQYRDLRSFRLIGEWIPLQTDQAGRVLREVAPAVFDVAVPTSPPTTLPLQVALIQDHRSRIPCPPGDSASAAWDADLRRPTRNWQDADWQPTATPAAPTTAKLIPIVCTGTGITPTALAAIYRHRWVAQENSFKDWLLPLGLDINHGYQKTAVENSEVTKRRTALETRLQTLTRWAISAGRREQRASRRYQRLWQACRADAAARFHAINTTVMEMEANGVAWDVCQRTNRELCLAANAETARERVAVERAYAACNTEFAKQQRYRKTQRDVLRALADLTATERQMYELDDRKDQVMTAFKVMLVNLVMWTRDQWFPAGYAQATWQRLAPFFRLPGRVHRYRDRVVLELRPFNDAALRRDLIALCTGVNRAAPRLPDGRRLELTLGMRSQRRRSGVLA